MKFRRSQVLRSALGWGLVSSWPALGLGSQANQKTDPGHSNLEDPLPTWRSGPLKDSLLAFIAAAVTPGSARYIPPHHRIASFDHDGTLWCERPLVQGVFTLAYLQAQLGANPALAAQPLIASLLEAKESDFTDGPSAADLLLRLSLWITGNQLETQFRASVQEFLATAIHPDYGVSYGQLTYQPQLELLAYLRAQGFETWLCSGGDVDFMRQVCEPLYGITPRQVIGSCLQKEYRLVQGRGVIWRLPTIDHINDGEGKPVGLDRATGQVPVFACGNVRSGGDRAMLTYSQSSPYPSLQLLINHDDSDREFAYAEPDHASLTAAHQRGWHVVSMKRDWLQIFAHPATRPNSPPS